MLKFCKKKTAIFIILFLVCYFGLTKNILAEEKELEDLKDLEKEIYIVNLINGLYLSKGQTEALLGLAKQAKSLKEFYLNKFHQFSSNSNETLKTLKEELMKDKGYVSEEVSKEVHSSHEETLVLKDEYIKQMQTLVGKVKKSLAENQLYLIEQFKPCLVPPKGPARIGQAQDSTGIVKKLELVRKMPDDKYSVKKDSLADKVLEKIHSKKDKNKEAGFSDEELKVMVLEVFDKARQLSGIDFQLKKEELVKELKEKIIPEQVYIVNIDKRIKEFLLNSSTIRILEERLEGKANS